MALYLDGNKIIGGSSTLAGLNDVDTSSATDGQVLKYNATTKKWVNSVGDNVMRDINYFDCFGNIVFSYSKEEFLSRSFHPTGADIPTAKTPLTFDNWNYSFANAQAYVTKYGKLNIGGIYHPTDNKTHIFLNIGNSAYSDIDIRFTATSSVDVDWGDGNTETVSGDFTGKHNYNDSGVFEITIDGEISLPSALLPDVVQKTYLTELFFNDIASIEGQGFMQCSNLTFVTLPEGMTSVNLMCIMQCPSLKWITLPISLTSISGAFYSNPLLKTVAFPERADVNLSYYNCGGLETLTFPETLTRLKPLSECGNLKSVIIPETITVIPNNAFKSNFSLKQITLPDGVTSLGTDAFYVCQSLVSMVLPKSLVSMGNRCFGNCESLVYLDFSNAEAVPTLDTNAFQGVSALSAIIVPDSLYSSWIAATNWSALASKIVKASEYIKPF